MVIGGPAVIVLLCDGTVWKALVLSTAACGILQVLPTPEQVQYRLQLGQGLIHPPGELPCGIDDGTQQRPEGRRGAVGQEIREEEPVGVVEVPFLIHALTPALGRAGQAEVPGWKLEDTVSNTSTRRLLHPGVVQVRDLQLPIH